MTAVEKRKSSIGNIKKSANKGTRSIGEKPAFSERKKERKKEGKEGGDFLLWLRTSCLQLAARIDQSQTEKESYVSVGRMKRGMIFEERPDMVFHKMKNI